MVEMSCVCTFSLGSITECDDFQVSLLLFPLVTIATGTSSYSSGVMGSKYEVSHAELPLEDTLLGKARAIGDVKTELSCDSELAAGRPSSRSLSRAAAVTSETSLGLMLRFRRI
jgi:hypothetical protein